MDELRGFSRTKNEKGAYKGRRFVGRIRGERSPRGEKAQGSKRPRPKLILWVAKRGTAELMGVSR